MVEKYFVE